MWNDQRPQDSIHVHQNTSPETDENRTSWFFVHKVIWRVKKGNSQMNPQWMMIRFTYHWFLWLRLDCMHRMYWNNRNISANWHVGVKGHELSLFDENRMRLTGERFHRLYTLDQIDSSVLYFFLLIVYTCTYSCYIIYFILYLYNKIYINWTNSSPLFKSIIVILTMGLRHCFPVVDRKYLDQYQWFTLKKWTNN